MTTAVFIDAENGTNLVMNAHPNAVTILMAMPIGTIFTAGDREFMIKSRKVRLDATHGAFSITITGRYMT